MAPEIRDYTLERDIRVMPFVKKMLNAIGNYDFFFNKTSTDEDAEKERVSIATFVTTHVFPFAMENKVRAKDMGHAFKSLAVVVEMLENRSVTPSDPLDGRLVQCAQQIIADLSKKNNLWNNFYVDELVEQFYKTEADGPVEDFVEVSAKLRVLGIDTDVLVSDRPNIGHLRADFYDFLYKTVVMENFSRFEIAFNEMNQVFAIIKTIINEVKDYSDNNLETARDIAEAKMWGVDDLDDLDILTIHQRAVAEKPEDTVY